jgi:predicted ATPase
VERVEDARDRPSGQAVETVSARGVGRPGNAFVGRDRDLERLAESLARSRLVVVVGPPGVGKTRLVRESVSRSRQSVALCDLRSVRSVEELASALVWQIAPRVALDTGDARRIAQVFDAVAATLARRRVRILVLDNADAALDATSKLFDRLLASADAPRVVVTSREPLEHDAATLLRLEPLAVEAAAVELFLSRWREREPWREPSRDEVRLVGELVRRLDGLPLAIELAAARAAAVGVADLLDALPTSVGATALGRAIRGSWERLDPASREVLARISIFECDFTIDAIEAVAAAPGDIVDRVALLVERSLLVAESDPASPGRRRYRLLQSIRDFARAELDRRASADAARRAAIEHLVAQLSSWPQGRPGPAVSQRVTRTVGALPDLLAGLGALSALPPDAGLGLYLLLDAVHERVAPLGRFLDITEPLFSRDRLDAASDALACLALTKRGRLARRVAREPASACFREAGERASRAGQPAHEALARSQLAVELALGGATRSEVDRAFEAARCLIARPHDPFVAGSVAMHRAFALEVIGDKQAAAHEMRLGIEQLRAAHDVLGAAHLEGSLAGLLVEAGDHGSARGHFERAIAEARAGGSAVLEGTFEGNLGVLLEDSGEIDEAAEHVERAIALASETGDAVFEGYHRCNRAALYLARRDDAAAIEHAELGLAKLRGGREDPRLAPLIAKLDAMLAVACASLGRREDAAAALDRASRGAGSAAVDRCIEIHRAHVAACLGDPAPPLPPDTTDPPDEGVRRARRLWSARRAVARSPITVGPGADWIATAGGTRVSLERRAAMRRILLRLIAARAGATRSIAWEELFRAGWPGERARDASARNRVYVTVSRLRALGMGEAIRSRDGGFALADDVEILPC